MKGQERSNRTSERAVNQSLATAIVKERPGWTGNVDAEATNVLAEAAKAPDVLVARPGGQAVVIETEHAPARIAVDDALVRLGARVRGTGERIETAFAVRLPEALRTSRPGDVEDAVRDAAYGLKICTSNADGAPATLWPQAPGEWAEASLPALVDLIEIAGLSERKLAMSRCRSAAFHPNSMSRVLSAFSASPNFARRVPKACCIRCASRRLWKVSTKSSA